MKIGLLGLGTIGSGVYEIIEKDKGKFKEHVKEETTVTRVLVYDEAEKNRKKDFVKEHTKLVTDVSEIINDPEIGLIVAVIGGLETEYSFIMSALNAGKHVVTANKAVVSEYMKELFEAAENNNVMFKFEASVGGGIPVIKSLQNMLHIDHITEIRGILNGTTNYILSNMTQKQAGFEETLAEAQKIGFAEADPTADVMGHDISRKIAILSSIACGGVVRDEDVYKRGITDVSDYDIRVTGDAGYRIKYIGHAICDENKLYTTVEPMLISKESIVGNVESEFNVCCLSGDVIGDLKFYGKGAGKDATADAVVGDVLTIISEGTEKEPVTLDKVLEKCGVAAFEGRYYMRLNIGNTSREEVLENIADIIKDYMPMDCTHYEIGHLHCFSQHEISADTFNRIAEEITAKGYPLFYARILE